MRESGRARVLVVAGLDPTGGAGLLADVAGLSSLAVAARGVASAIVPQSRRGVERVAPIALDVFHAQWTSALSEGRPDVVKVGLLPDAATIEALAARLDELAPAPVVVANPVLAAGAGGWALEAAGIAAWARRLLPRATIATMNRGEAARLLAAVGKDSDGDEAATLRAATGARAVLVTDGDGPGPELEDALAAPDGRRHAWRAARIAGGPFHGTGCALATAIAAGLAQGRDLVPAVEAARGWVRARIALAARAGRWCLPLVADAARA